MCEEEQKELGRGREVGGRRRDNIIDRTGAGGRSRKRWRRKLVTFSVRVVAMGEGLVFCSCRVVGS